MMNRKRITAVAAALVATLGLSSCALFDAAKVDLEKEIR